MVVVPAPNLHLLPSIFKAHEPVLVQAFRPEPAVEGLDDDVGVDERGEQGLVQEFVAQPTVEALEDGFCVGLPGAI
jgi:hypothetical protein